MCTDGFAAAANDMTAGDSAAISAIASNATILAFICFRVAELGFHEI